MFSETRNSINSPPSCWPDLNKFGFQRRFIDDILFSSGNSLCQSVLGKKSVVIFDNEDFLHQNVEKFPCHVPACMKVFETLIAFEEHYNSSHRYVCGTCHKRLPSSHLLDLHISETHDSYFAALAEKQPMFQCFIESCDSKHSTKKERRSHCIEVHKFPPDFRYDSHKKEEKKKKAAVGADSSTLPTKMLGFGHNSNRGLFRNRRRGGLSWHNKRSRDKSEEREVSMTDLEEALPSME